MKPTIRKVALMSMTLCLLMTATLSHAARIYNFTNKHIKVIGAHITGADSTEINPGEKSKSINWISSLRVKVNILARDGWEQVCELGFKGAKDMQGGNYLLVSQAGARITCQLCDSNHNMMHILINHQDNVWL